MFQWKDREKGQGHGSRDSFRSYKLATKDVHASGVEEMCMSFVHVRNVREKNWKIWLGFFFFVNGLGQMDSSGQLK